MNWELVAAYLEGFSSKSTADADAFEERYGLGAPYNMRLLRTHYRDWSNA